MLRFDKGTYLSLLFKLISSERLINSLCVSWSFPKTNLETNFLNLVKVKVLSMLLFVNSNF